MFKVFNKPEYIHRPSQIFRRIFSRKRASGFIEANLPWGMRIRVNTLDHIGGSIGRMGVYDLAVTEALWRLTDAGERVVDAGANVGYMTSVLARRIGQGGTVYSYEPHPVIFRELTANIAGWKTASNAPTFLPNQVGLSEHNGVLQLMVPKDFEHHRGESSFSEMNYAEAGDTTIDVPVVRLDDQIGGNTIGVMKIDVEGHEKHVFLGASALLSSRRIRDIVYEDHHAYPNDLTKLFTDCGYTIFRLNKRLSRLQLLPPQTIDAGDQYDPPNYIATANPERAEARFAKRGWYCLAG